MKIPTGLVGVSVVAFVVLILLATAVRLESRLAGALSTEQRSTERAYRAERAHVLRLAAAVQNQAKIGLELAQKRPRITVSIPPTKAAIDDRHVAEVVPRDTVPSPAKTADVTINDTAYAVPVRVAEVVRDLKLEVQAADSLRILADSLAKAAPVLAAVADTAIRVAKKRPNVFVRVGGKAVNVICAAAGGGVGALVGGAKGAAIGAGGALAVCAILH